MHKNLKKFDLLYNQIIQEKRANIFTKIMTDQRYLQDDFRQVWNGSGFKKLLYALDIAIGNGSKSKVVIKDLPELNVNKMLDLKSQSYEDLPAGTVARQNAGLRLTYDILPEYKYPLLKILINRDENTNSNNSNFGMFLNYFNQLIITAQQGLQNKFRKRILNIQTDIKLEIIAVPAGKDNQDFTTNKKHSHLSQSSFTCTIFLWFDAQKFKNELRENLKNTLDDSSKNANADTDSNDKSSQINLDNFAARQKEIQSINVNNTKIRLGKQDITITRINDGTLTNLYNGLKNNNLDRVLYKMGANALGLNKIFGIGGKDQNGEKPDKIRVNQHFWHSLFNVADLNNPYANVLSKVELQQWLYKDKYDKSSVNSDKNHSANFAIQMRKPFSQTLLKIGKSDPGPLTGDLSNTKIWRIQEVVGRTIWPSNADPSEIKKYLNPNNINQNNSKKLTCRWQYYIDNTRSLYAEYRVAIELTAFYNILKNIEDLLSQFKTSIDQLQNNNITSSDIHNLNIIIGPTKKHPDYLIAHQSAVVPNAQQSTYNKVQNILSILQTSNILAFLKELGDNSTNISKRGISSHIKKYNCLYQLLINNVYKIRAINDSSINYENWKLNNLFSAWWQNYYKQSINKKTSNYDFVSQKNLYTNNNKAPTNYLPTNAKHGFAAFKDVDNTAAEYFNNVILSKADPFTLNNQSLDEFFAAYIKNLLNNYQESKLKEYINVFHQFNNIIKNINLYIPDTLSNKQDEIIRAASQYIISKK